MDRKIIYTTASDGEGAASLIEREVDRYVILRGLVAGEGVSINVIDADDNENSTDDHLIQISASGGGGSDLNFVNANEGYGIYLTRQENDVIFNVLNFSGDFNVSEGEGSIYIALQNDIFVRRASEAPDFPNSNGVEGEYFADEDYAYFCIGENSWIRVAKDESWSSPG